MESRRRFSRRRLIAGLAGVVTPLSLAGCASSEESETSTETETSGDGQQPDATEEESEENDQTETESGGNDQTEAESGGSGEEGSTTPETVTESETEEDDLDLQEANVVDVAFEQTNGQYNFDVALHHDDNGEDGYANWWQVERLDGTQLGRRELLHAHSQQPFTRSETIEIPDDVTCVVVRGHDQTHGYGGVAMLVNLDSDATRGVTQGPDRQSFDGSDCP